jgi:hypothetical protein
LRIGCKAWSETTGRQRLKFHFPSFMSFNVAHKYVFFDNNHKFGLLYAITSKQIKMTFSAIHLNLFSHSS